MCTWGMAYRVASDNVEAVKEYLDYREKNGYTVHVVPVYGEDGVCFAQKVVISLSSSFLCDAMFLSGELGHAHSTCDHNPLKPSFENQALVYVATMTNEAFLGYAPVSELAAHILQSKGASGPNWEYLLELVIALNGLVPHHNDRHLLDLDRAIRSQMLAWTEDERFRPAIDKYIIMSGDKAEKETTTKGE